MAQSSSMLQNSFRNFQSGKFKEAYEDLGKFKQLKESSDANYPMQQVNENIILCEYGMNRDNPLNIIQKLEDINEEIRGKPKKKKQEDDNNSILQYNKALILYLCGKVKQSNQILKQIIINNDTYLQVRVYLLLIETSFQLSEYSQIAELYKKLCSEEVQNNLCNKQFKNDDGQQKQFYSSLLFGSEIPYLDRQPNNICREEYNFILSVIKFRLLIKEQKKPSAQLESSYKAFLNILENQQQMKQDELEYSKELQIYLTMHTKMVYKMLQAQRHLVVNDNVSKCIRLMNPHNDGQELQTKWGLYQTFIYNNLGCVHAKMNKYGLAVIYFQKAIQSLKQQSKEINQYESILQVNIRQKMYTIYSNLADALFLNKKYKNALSIYNQLVEQCSHSYKFWYNRGVCYIQEYHDQLQEQQEICGIIDEVHPKYQIEKGEEGGQARRIILQSKEVHSDMDEEEQDLQLYKMDQKNEQAFYQQSKQAKELLTNAIKSFRNVLSMQRRDKKDDMIQIDNEIIQMNNSQIFESGAVFLCYALLCRGDYNQAIAQAKETLEFNISDNNQYILIQYILEALITTNKLKEAQTFLQSATISAFLVKYLNNTCLIQCRNTIGINCTNMEQFCSKTIYHYNLAVLYLHNKNNTQAQNQIQLLLQVSEINVNSQTQIIPVPILNLMIWYNLRTENVSAALQFIKRRRLITGPMGKHKISLLNITK